MNDEDNLRDKYERLCSQFDKLRNKYRIDKEDYAHQIKKKDLKIQILKKEIDELKVGDGRSQSCKAMVDGSLMIPNDCNLAIQQNEIGFENADLQFISINNHSNELSNDLIVTEVTQLSDLKKSQSPMGLSISDRFYIPNNDRTDNRLISNNSSLCSLPPSSSSLQEPNSSETKTDLVETDQELDLVRVFIGQFVQMITQWIEALDLERARLGNLKNQPQTDQAVLVERIAKLEIQLNELNVELQFERTQRLLAEQKLNTKSTVDFVLINNLSKDNESSSSLASVRPTHTISDQDRETNFELFRQSMEKRLYKSINDARYFANLANLLQDELDFLVPWIRNLLYLNYDQISELSKANALGDALRTQLDLTNSRNLKQVSEMANIMTDATNELQLLKSSSTHSKSKFKKLLFKFF